MPQDDTLLCHTLQSNTHVAYPPEGWGRRWSIQCLPRTVPYVMTLTPCGVAFSFLYSATRYSALRTSALHVQAAFKKSTASSPTEGGSNLAAAGSPVQNWEAIKREDKTLLHQVNILALMVLSQLL